jgi:hypothetical protein
MRSARGTSLRPVLGVAIELLALIGSLALAPLVPRGLAYGLYVIVVILLATFLLHCPAHYIVGVLLGIRFVEMRLSRTTLVRALPPRVKPFAKPLRVFTLRVDRASVGKVSRRRAACMYASGTVVSVLSALVLAAVATWSEPELYAAGAWAVALAYLLSDLVLSPQSGDLKRAKLALGPRSPS